MRYILPQMEISPSVVPTVGNHIFGYEFSLTNGSICSFKNFRMYLQM